MSKLLLIIFLSISLLLCLPSAKSQTLSSTITLTVDFGSTISYINNECGGILISGDTTVYPPCTSYKDAGNRARQYINGNIPIPDNNALVINVINTQSSQSISGESAQLGNLFGFCDIRVLVETTTSPVIINGASATSHFVSLEEPDQPNTSYTCSARKLLLVRYINFVNWGNQTIFYVNVNQIDITPKFQLVYFLYVSTSGSNSIVNVQPKNSNYEYGYLQFTISSGTFTNISSSLTLAPFNFIATKTSFVTDKFLNSILNNSPLIYSKVGHLDLGYFSLINNVIMNNDLPIVKTLNLGNNYNFNFINVTNSVFSKFLHSENSQINPQDVSQPFNFYNFLINNNTIISNINDPSDSVLSLQNFEGDSYTLSFSNVASNGNQVLGDKPFIWNKNLNTNLLLCEIPDSFSIGIKTENSNNIIFSTLIDSIIPFAGNNSFFDYSMYPLTNSNNFNYCEVCQIIVDGQIVYNTF
ncbi:hypothetical protein RB653_000646 [Dictyostelium firmibasis]|uniref:Carbohydrate binding domain-containing protein n=1 Tax=Dictyostelium firmibasis TaxID=79012 RepID=A0AAN7YQT1_9MYCE